jgi:uncharacterized protein involved in type VI secretion and phage assembly
MGRIHGVVVGTVKSVDDPNGEGRVLVEFPWMGGNNQNYWAPVATLMSGNGRGSWFMPEVDDEVLVAFDHEDVNHPYILGFLWNGKDKPPETNSHKRLLKSVQGHTILLDDSDDGKKVQITSAGGLQITMDDSSGSEKISITTPGGSQITMDDTSKEITIKSPQQVTVNALQVSVNAPQVSVGEDAAHPAVWGDILYAYLQELYATVLSHQHVGELALGIFPVTPMIGVPPPPPVPEMLSTVVTGA